MTATGALARIRALATAAGLDPAPVRRSLRDSPVATLARRTGIQAGPTVRALAGSRWSRALSQGGITPTGLRTTTPRTRLVMAAGALCCLAAVVVTQVPTGSTPAGGTDQAVARALVERQLADTSRSNQRPAGAAAKAAPKAATKPRVPTPVAGLSQAQMDNAAKIIQTGQAMGLPKRAYVIAIATAMQESRLFNLASDVVPESLAYPHQGTGYDHDSVGLFQQRSSMGWGSVRDLMNPNYAAAQFFKALRSVSGWQAMALTYAAQTVQGSAFPDAYAQHEWVAQRVVNAFTSG